MIVCLCEGISERTIELAAKGGAKSVEEVSIRCGAGTGCGACHEQILEIISQRITVEEAKPCGIRPLGSSDTKRS